MPKIKNFDLSDKYITIYKGYYNDYESPLAVSNDKRLVRDYLELNRGLKSKHYTIKSDIMEESLYYCKYEDFIIGKFFNLALPLIDYKIINREYGELDIMTDSLLNKIKYFTFLVNKTKDGKDDVKQMLSAIKIIENYKENPKKNSHLFKAHMSSHPLINCNIGEYLYLLKMHKEDMDRIDRYKYSCDKD